MGKTKYIDAEALIDELDRQMADLEADVKADKDNVFLIGLAHISVVSTINDFPAADVVEVVRCKDCKYAYMTTDGECKYCDIWFPDEKEYLDGDYYCASGERKDG